MRLQTRTYLCGSVRVRASASDASGNLIPSSKAQSSAPRPSPAEITTSGGSLLGFDVPAAVALLVLVNCGCFVAAAVGKSVTVASLAINPISVKWWAFASSAFVHQNVEQLGCNMFLLFFFSQMVYRELGGVGVWFSYVLCGLGANLSSWFLLAGTAKAKATALLGLASSGGTLGLCLAAVILSYRPTLTYFLGVALTMNFVGRLLLNAPLAGIAAAAGTTATTPTTQNTTQVLTSYLTDPVGQSLALMKGLKRSALDPGNTWVLGAVAAALLVVLLARLPDGDPE